MSYDKADSAAPEGVDRATFQAKLDALRVREKAHTTEGDAIAAARRRLPMVAVDGATPLIGENGVVPLLDAFEGRRMLIAYYFMWDTGKPAPDQCEGAPSIRRRSANCLSCILVTLPSLCSAKARTKRASGTATSWAGNCPGTRPRTRSTLFSSDAGKACFTSFATCGRGPMSSRLTGHLGAASRQWTTATGYST
jgi:hypothetical protein